MLDRNVKANSWLPVRAHCPVTPPLPFRVPLAWKSAVVALHPDKLAGRGESPAAVNDALEATKALNAAYEEVMRERASLAQQAA